MLADRLQQHAGGGEVALVGHLPHDFRVFLLVEIMLVGVEDAIAAQAIRLMDLEVKTDRSHDGSLSCANLRGRPTDHSTRRRAKQKNPKNLSRSLCETLCPPCYAPGKTRCVKRLRAGGG